MSPSRTIQLRNVRVNNLKQVDLDIPHGQWLAICGLSGSGKSSLAFDTLYAEGQRRYLASLSPGTRRFVAQLDKPDADTIENIPPAVAVQAPRGTADPMTTVGDATEITEYLRLLFTHTASIVCPTCDENVTGHSATTVAATLNGLPSDTRFLVGFNVPDDVPLGEAWATARRNGFQRGVLDGKMVTFDVPCPSSSQDPGAPLTIIVDRLKSGASDLSRLRESIETAFQFGTGVVHVFLAVDEQQDVMPSWQAGSPIDGRPYHHRTFSTQRRCSTCQRLFPTPEPRLFDFTHRRGACSECQGRGVEKEPPHALCGMCHGTQLHPDALAFRIAGNSIADVCQKEITAAAQWLQEVPWSSSHRLIAQRLIEKMETRFDYLIDVGLGYLALDRTVRTLSQGESQRIALTACLSSTLTGMLYVLDEPSIGLHHHNVQRLTRAIKRLNDRGNTVVVVDHDQTMIQAASRIVEVGPEAGDTGGQIVFDGSVAQLTATQGSPTGDFLAGRRGVCCRSELRRTGGGAIRLTGASGHNLKTIDVEFPLRSLCVVTGVSGAGKSTLVRQTLYGALQQRKGDQTVPALPYDNVEGEHQIDEVVLVDHTPIGKTARSNPVTYVKAFDDIRKAFAETPDAKMHHVAAGDFSFNVPGGRCEKCQGKGALTIDMQFLPDVSVTCDECRGTRFGEKTLSVRYRGQTIADVLNLTVREAFTFFRGQPKVQSKLKTLIDVGLDYIRLGQPAPTLSTGEAQRLKLAVYLNASRKKRALFLLEEPTTGLHMADVTRLLDCFEMLLTGGHSLIVVEHNLQLIKNADWVIDLGPGPSEKGGTVVASGPPEVIAQCSQSLTGQALRQVMLVDT